MSQAQKGLPRLHLSTLNVCAANVLFFFHLELKTSELMNSLQAAAMRVFVVKAHEMHSESGTWMRHLAPGYHVGAAACLCLRHPA